MNRTLFSSSDLVGCGWMRSYLPAKYLDASFMGGYINQHDLSNIDNIIFQRHTHFDIIQKIRDLRLQGKKVYYDIDDDLWNIEETNPAKGGYCSNVLSNVETMASLCDGVFVSTEPLKELLTKFNPCVNIVPNLVEIPSGTKELHDKIRIGYAGSASHVGDFSDKLKYSLVKLAKKYRGKVEFIFFGYVPPELKEYSHSVGGVEPQHYLPSLNYLDFDISLIPLGDNVFNRSKSNLKWLDSAICKACPVASDVYCYNEIQDGVTGIKIQDDRWYDVLEELINNDVQRKTIAEQSYQYVLENYTWKNAKHKQSEVYTSIKE